MTGNLIPREFRQFNCVAFLRALLVNAVINTAIAIILTAIGFGRGFRVTLVFSQCIGMSIMAVNFALIPILNRVTRIPYQLLIIAGAVLIGAAGGTLLGAAANGINLAFFLREYSALFGQSVLIGIFFGFVISYVFISLGKISEEKVKRLEAEKNAVEAELQLLQSQIEPHFLFNTLSNIISLIDTDREKARRMLESFTTFLRSSLQTARQRTTTVSREMDLVNNYLAISSVRMGERLRWRIDVPEELNNIPIPPLLIQPLVENAVKHGLEPIRAGGEITVTAVRSGDILRFIVADSGLGVREKSAGVGIGLENIRKRLDLAYGERGKLVFEENVPHGVRVVIEMPYEAAKS